MIVVESSLLETIIITSVRSILNAMRSSDMVTTSEMIKRQVVAQSEAQAAAMGRLADSELEQICRRLEEEFNISIGGGGIVEGEGNLVEWLDDRRTEIDWAFWNRYRKYMCDIEGRATSVFDESVGDVTDRILTRIGNPAQQGPWSRKGLVAGQVQSGKTSNYIGLINKSIDAGYKLIIILAGAHDSLRSQTQERVNEGVLGFDTLETFSNNGKSMRTGVGKLPDKTRVINCSTTRDSKGDFKFDTAKSAHQNIRESTTILVVKKYSSILQNVYAWATGLQSHEDENGRKVVSDIPLLVIDDEADYASVDTKAKKNFDEEIDPSTINKKIRQILETFEQSSYVAYTATPFANIFIDPDAVHVEVGKDLFPDDFIITLPESSDYFGPVQFFGLNEAGSETAEALPLQRHVKDHQTWLRDGHKVDEKPGDQLPESLCSAIDAYLLTLVSKKLRSTKQKHTSMLIHVTRFKELQSLVRDQVKEYLNEVLRSIRYGQAEPDCALERLQDLYQSDFIITSHKVLAHGSYGVRVEDISPWSEIRDELIRLSENMNEIQVQTVNGDAQDYLMYRETPDGLSVIAIGGDKLSRGLTLEGLTVSYYLRASKAYDTLMQMGRWFGYRPGYLDLCRLYTTPHLIKWYERVTSAASKLYDEIVLLGRMGRTPRQVGLKVQRHPDGLMVTAPNKKRFAQRLRVGFAGTIAESLLMSTSENARKANLSVLQDLLEDLKISSIAPESGKARREQVDPEVVLRFLSRYVAHEKAGQGLPNPLVEYIQKCLALPIPELRRWTVMIGNRSDANKMGAIKQGTIGLYERKPSPETGQDSTSRSVKRLVSPGDELVCTKPGSAEWDKAIEWTREYRENNPKKNVSTNEVKRPSAAAERAVRSNNHGLLLVYPLSSEVLDLGEGDPLVGFAVSFPGSDNKLDVEYEVNSVYWDNLFSEEADDE